jgi:hypothetical protein
MTRAGFARTAIREYPEVKTTPSLGIQFVGSRPGGIFITLAGRRFKGHYFD